MRAAPVVERLRDLLVKSDATTGVISSYRTIGIDFHKLGEHGLIGIVEQRRRLVDKIDIARLRIRELNAKALTTQGRIGLYGSKAEWERMEEERRALKADAERVADEERAMREDSQRRERFINLFQLFVDALNSQVGQCNALSRKMVIDTEERLLIYQAQVDTDIPGSKVQISADLFPPLPVRLNCLSVTCWCRRNWSIASGPQTPSSRASSGPSSRSRRKAPAGRSSIRRKSQASPLALSAL